MIFRHAEFDEVGNITKILTTPYGFIEAGETANDTTHYVDVPTRTIHPKQGCAHAVTLVRDALMASANVMVAAAGEAVRSAEQLVMDAVTPEEQAAATIAQQAAAVAQAQSEAQLMAASNNLQVSITGLPIPCTLTVNNDRHDILDGTAELSFIHPGDYTLTIESVKYLRWKGKVTL